ncbi:hypothetical protein C0995_011190 [Termitomyces sp. Mi166|nr:hypothetical protein C0995_011190 [Termitomyces sp. Mi166\
MPPKKEVEQETTVTVSNFWHSPRRTIYAVAWILVFCIAVAELGLVSQQLHRGGNNIENYGNMMFKHILGILLFTMILIFLMCIGHIYASIGRKCYFPVPRRYQTKNRSAAQALSSNPARIARLTVVTVIPRPRSQARDGPRNVSLASAPGLCRYKVWLGQNHSPSLPNQKHDHRSTRKERLSTT